MSELLRGRGRRIAGAARVAFASCFVFASLADGWARAEEVERTPPKTYHATAVVRGDLGLRIIDYWSRGSDMLARTLVGGHEIVTIVFGGRYVVYDALTGKGLDIERAPRALAADAGRARPFAFELAELKAEGGERVEETNFGSRKGEVWQVTDGRGRRKVWVTVGVPTVPLRVETFDRATSATVDLDYQNWTFDLELSDAFFAPPARIELQNFEFDAFLEATTRGRVGAVPILYPDLLFGAPPG